MPTIDFRNAYYIKLGRGGEWETDSISSGKLRIGWSKQQLEDINLARWDIIEAQLREKDRGKRIAAATSDFHVLQFIAQSTPDDIWITFHKSKMWWTRLAAGPIEADSISKFRSTLQPWSDRSSTGKLLVVNSLPGKLSQVQGFRATACRVKYSEVLRRVLNGTSSDLAAAINESRSALSRQLSEAIKELHWKDFETLVDLVFRAAGWVRIGVLGEQTKAHDLELLEPITGDRYVVQVKSQADRYELRSTASQFASDAFRRVFFVVHSPVGDLESEVSMGGLNYVELVSPERLAELALDAGLAKWIADKVF